MSYITFYTPLNNKFAQQTLGKIKPRYFSGFISHFCNSLLLLYLLLSGNKKKSRLNYI